MIYFEDKFRFKEYIQNELNFKIHVEDNNFLDLTISPKRFFSTNYLDKNFFKCENFEYYFNIGIDPYTNEICDNTTNQNFLFKRKNSNYILIFKGIKDENKKPKIFFFETVNQNPITYGFFYEEEGEMTNERITFVGISKTHIYFIDSNKENYTFRRKKELEQQYLIPITHDLNKNFEMQLIYFIKFYLDVSNIDRTCETLLTFDDNLPFKQLFYINEEDKGTVSYDENVKFD